MVGFEQATNGIQLYEIANLDKTSRPPPSQYSQRRVGGRLRVSSGSASGRVGDCLKDTWLRVGV